MIMPKSFTRNVCHVRSKIFPSSASVKFFQTSWQIVHAFPSYPKILASLPWSVAIGKLQLGVGVNGWKISLGFGELTKTPFFFIAGPFSIFKRCLYSRYLHEYAFDYIKSFWSQYLDLPKFFMLHFSEGHEGTAEVVQYMDQHLKDFLNYSTINFINTSIFLVSDHGNHMNFILRQSDAEAYRAEVTAPLLNIIGNHDVMDENLSATNHNAYALVSMYDVHKTISQLVLRGIKKSTRSATRSTGAEDVFGRRTSRGYDLLRQQVSFKRSCSKAGISSKQCHCWPKVLETFKFPIFIFRKRSTFKL